MKFIKPSEISGKIMTLLDESDMFVVLVSPYCKISKWYKLIKKIEQLKSRNIQLNVFVRAGDENINTFKDLKKNDIDFQVIPNLHGKLYLNEKYGIVTSLNLLLNSEINSLEIGYITETEQELNELFYFCQRYLHLDINSQINENYNNKSNKSENINISISRNLNKIEIYGSVKVWFEEDSIRINTGVNNYECFLWNKTNKENLLRISGILSGEEFERIKSHKKHFENSIGLNLEFINGEKKYYDAVWGTSSQNFISNSMDTLDYSERRIIEEIIIKFVTIIDKFKKKSD